MPQLLLAHPVLQLPLVHLIGHREPLRPTQILLLRPSLVQFPASGFQALGAATLGVGPGVEPGVTGSGQPQLPLAQPLQLV